MEKVYVDEYLYVQLVKVLWTTNNKWIFVIPDIFIPIKQPLTTLRDRFTVKRMLVN